MLKNTLHQKMYTDITLWITDHDEYVPSYHPTNQLVSANQRAN